VAAGHPTATRGRTRVSRTRARRGVARTGRRNRPLRREFESRSAPRRAASFGSFRAVEGFYIAGGTLAAWALFVSALGVMREDFPRTARATRLVGAISVVLVLTAIGLAIYLSANEEEKSAEGEHAALVLGA
jgi:hypothetical protein